jgi:hypothetical protein
MGGGMWSVYQQYYRKTSIAYGGTHRDKRTNGRLWETEKETLGDMETQKETLGYTRAGHESS